jgi:hypothetical protein
MTSSQRHLHARAALTCASILGFAALSRAAVIVSDDFNSYSNGGLAYQSYQGTGFGGVWYDPSGTINVTTGVVNGDGNAKRDFSPNAFGSSGTLWLSFDWGHDSSNTSGTYGGLTFFEGGTERLLIGNTWNAATWDMNGASPTTVISSIGIKTGVARITLGVGAASTVDLWVGNTGSAVDVSGAPMATTTGRDLDGVNIIRIMGNNAQTFDNFVIGQSNIDVEGIIPTGTWSNAAGGLWGAAGNWSSTLVGGGSGNTALLNTLNITADTTVNLDTPLTIGNLVFGDTDTSSAAGWTLANNGGRRATFSPWLARRRPSR